jgi:Undecaprenyl-phosphate glucose phosphotransferase
VVLVAAFLLAGALRFDDLKVENQEYYNYYVQLFAFMVLSWVVVALLVRSSVFYPSLEIRRSVAKLINTILIQAAVIALLLVSLKGYYYSRLFFTYFYLLFVPGVLLGRIFIIKRFRVFLQKPSNARAIALIGHTKEADDFAAALAAHPEFGLRLAKRFSNQTDLSNPEEAEQMKHDLSQENIEEIYCGLPSHHPQILNWLKLADANLIRFRYLPALGIKQINLAHIEMLGDVPILIPRKEPLEIRFNRILKRAFDIVFSSLVILIVFPIVLPLFALIVKLTSKGPVFFKQQRSGLNNDVFTVLKFRTMAVNKEADILQASADDIRITPFGKFLRKHNLDELPQFINVFLGQMSVVGPRPHMLAHTEAYRQLIDEFMVRHLIKPGITGLAQTQGLRGETSNPEQMRARVKADVYYLENWSLLLDLKIVGDTVWNMVTGKNRGM